jgi:hypothetical protein
MSFKIRILERLGTDEKRVIEAESLKTMLDAMEKAEQADSGIAAHGYAVVTYDEAVSIIRNRKLTPVVHVRHFAPCADPVKRAEHQGYDLGATIRAPRREILSMLDSMYGKRFKTECMVKLGFLGYMVFIG